MAPGIGPLTARGLRAAKRAEVASRLVPKSKARMSTSTTPLTAIEKLPAEVLEMIYVESRNPWLAFASPDLYYSLNSDRNKKQMLQFAFREVIELDYEYTGHRFTCEYRALMDDRIKEFGNIVSQPWFMKAIYSPQSSLFSHYSIRHWVRNNRIEQLFTGQQSWNQAFGDFFCYVLVFFVTRRFGERLSDRLCLSQGLLRAIEQGCIPAACLLSGLPFHDKSVHRKLKGKHTFREGTQRGLSRAKISDKVYASNHAVPRGRWIRRWATMTLEPRATFAWNTNLTVEPAAKAMMLSKGYADFMTNFINGYLGMLAEKEIVLAHHGRRGSPDVAGVYRLLKCDEFARWRDLIHLLMGKNA